MMKTTSQFLALGVVLALGLTAANARADLEFSASVAIHAKADFDTPLAACGTWVDVRSYGRCWRPAGVVVGWRPYCDGYWVWTDDGWYWVSDEPWAWACYHYGYWAYDTYYGWVWIPDVVWAPAWVSWRIGGGCIGWAPNPPPGAFYTRRAPDSAFVFVGAEHFAEPIKPSVLVANSAAVIKQTKYVANERRVTKDFNGAGARVAVFNEGPGLDAIQKISGRQFKQVSIGDAVHRTSAPTGGFSRNASPPAKPEVRQQPNPPSRPPQNRNEPAPPAGAGNQPPAGHSHDQGPPSGGGSNKSQGQGRGDKDNQDGPGGGGFDGGGGRGH